MRNLGSPIAKKLLLALALSGGVTAAHVSGLLARKPPQPVVVPKAAMEPPAVLPAPKPAEPPQPLTQSADDGFVVRRILEVPQPFRHGDYVWDEAGVPDGPIVITVDLEAQVLSVFRAGYEIGSAVILYGANDKPTPLGTFPILEKDADHVSNLYDAPMPYMLRLTGDGIAIHGTPKVAWDRATHGCIGVPDAFAKRVFGVTRIGDKVIITSGRTLDMGQPIVS